MSEWKFKRFWKSATVSETAKGFTVLLDGRSVKTPAKAALDLPTRALAEAVSAEWAAQQDEVDPATMPFTRTANAAIDKVSSQRAEVAQMLADYGDSDLLCYRADGPELLVSRQAEVWDPYLDWAARELAARLTPRQGVIHAPQDPTALHALHARTFSFSSFELAAFHDLVSLTGSLILGFAATQNYQSPERIWAASRIDEEWQIEQWGADEEATEVAEFKRGEFLHAKRFFDAVTLTGSFSN